MTERFTLENYIIKSNGEILGVYFQDNHMNMLVDQNELLKIANELHEENQKQVKVIQKQQNRIIQLSQIIIMEMEFREMNTKRFVIDDNGLIITDTGNKKTYVFDNINDCKDCNTLLNELHAENNQIKNELARRDLIINKLKIIKEEGIE